VFRLRGKFGNWAFIVIVEKLLPLLRLTDEETRDG
jgi:hypothetical protein